MITDILNSIKANLYERVTSPLVGTFLFSWIIFNWRIPIVLIWGDDSYPASKVSCIA